MKQVYIHRGHDRFYPECLVAPRYIINRSLKPECALFACKQETDDWIKWCKSENYGTLEGWKSHFLFTLSDDTRLLILNTIDKYRKLYSKYVEDVPYGIMYNWTDVRKKYDAVYIGMSSDYRLIEKFPLYDVDQLIVFNPEVVQVVKEDSL